MDAGSTEFPTQRIGLVVAMSVVLLGVGSIRLSPKRARWDRANAARSRGSSWPEDEWNESDGHDGIRTHGHRMTSPDTERVRDRSPALCPD